MLSGIHSFKAESAKIEQDGKIKKLNELMLNAKVRKITFKLREQT